MKKSSAKELDKICNYLMETGKGHVRIKDLVSNLHLKDEKSIGLLTNKYRIIPPKNKSTFEGVPSLFIDEISLRKLASWENNKFLDKHRTHFNYKRTGWVLLFTILILILTIITTYFTIKNN